MTKRNNTLTEEPLRTGGVSPETSRAIAIMRFILPFAVMAVHVYHTQDVRIKGMFYDFADYPIARSVMYFVRAFVADFSVPCFFFISGYLFFSSGFSRDIYRRKVKSRCWSLLFPYILWNAIMIGYMAFRYTPLFTKFAPSLAGQSLDMSVGEFFIGLTLVPHNGTLWFLRELMVMVLVSPLIYYLVKRFRWIIIGVFWCVWAAFITCTRNYDLINASQAVLFFSTGCAFAVMGKDPVATMGKRLTAACIIFGVLGITGFTLCFFTHWTNIMVLKPFSVPCALVIAFTLSWRWGKSRLRERLLGPHALSDRFPGLSFMIFTAHYLLIFDMTVLVFTLVKPSTDLGVAGCMVLVCIGIALCIALCYRVLGFVWPAAQRLLTGRAGKKKKRAAAAAAA